MVGSWLARAAPSCTVEPHELHLKAQALRKHGMELPKRAWILMEEMRKMWKMVATLHYGHIVTQIVTDMQALEIASSFAFPEL
jgi:hypothetical protein